VASVTVIGDGSIVLRLSPRQPNHPLAVIGRELHREFSIFMARFGSEGAGDSSAA